MASQPPTPSPRQMAQTIYNEALSNIIHDAIIWRHKDHKEMMVNLDPATKLPLCGRCGLPRLLDPPIAPAVRGATSDPPADTVYCDKKPWCRKPGFDIYGNPFPKADVTGRPPTKKEREAAKNSNKKDDGTPASNEGGDFNGTAPPSPSAEDGPGGGNGKEKLEKGEKKASKIDEKLKKGEYIPWQTCPNCKRSLLITRFAKHLEQCMGLSGRAASRNAMAKINGATPSASRSGTPAPDGQNGEEEDEDEKIKGPGGVRKKVLKKQLKKQKSTSKLPPGDAAAGGKRDRDEMLLGEEGDEEENVQIKKRQKLTRVGSTTSIGSQPGSAVEMGREESQDGSFIVDDDGSVDE